jgi:palmitoyltransferase
VLTHLKVVTQVILNHKSYTSSITHGPYFVGTIMPLTLPFSIKVILYQSPVLLFGLVFAGLLTWFRVCLFSSLATMALCPAYHSGTQGYAFTHLIFALMFLLCCYNFFHAIALDPGTCPKPVNDTELKDVRLACFISRIEPYSLVLRSSKTWPAMVD